jgi:hypothetical protein
VSGRAVEVRIDELVAPGVRAADAAVIARAAERELGRLVAGGAAWPGAAASAGGVARVSATIPAGASPASAGVQLARTLHRELGR